jgi:hypothetical protein
LVAVIALITVVPAAVIAMLIASAAVVAGAVVVALIVSRPIITLAFLTAFVPLRLARCFDRSRSCGSRRCRNGLGTLFFTLLFNRRSGWRFDGGGCGAGCLFGFGIGCGSCGCTPRAGCCGLRHGARPPD